MKKYIILFFVFLMSCKNNKPTNSEALNGRYDIKSAIVESELDFLGMSKSTSILMFDDFGKKHKQIKIDKSNFLGNSIATTTHTLIDENYIYTWEEGSKKGTKINLEKNENDVLAQRFNFKKLDDEFKNQYKVKQLADKDINGKTCSVYQMQIDKSKIKYYVWKNIPLSFELEMDGKTISSKLVSIDEKPTFQSNDFEIPKDIQFEEMNLDAQNIQQH